jgi:hypothetical protein
MALVEWSHRLRGVVEPVGRTRGRPFDCTHEVTPVRSSIAAPAAADTLR